MASDNPEVAKPMGGFEAIVAKAIARADRLGLGIYAGEELDGASGKIVRTEWGIRVLTYYTYGGYRGYGINDEIVPVELLLERRSEGFVLASREASPNGRGASAVVFSPTGYIEDVGGNFTDSIGQPPISERSQIELMNRAYDINNQASSVILGFEAAAAKSSGRLTWGSEAESAHAIESLIPRLPEPAE